MIDQLINRYPNFAFETSETFMWSPSQKTIFYDPDRVNTENGIFSLLHEIGHALANHERFTTDLTLIKMELEAWSFAKQIGSSLGITINQNHVEDCLDSYRDWLHSRSRCPDCSQVNPQSEAKKYDCFNCGSTWKVSGSQLCSVRSRT